METVPMYNIGCINLGSE